jgi:hypothetical protein
MEDMADNVLTDEEQAFVNANADEIRAMANLQFAGNMPMDKRAIYQTIFIKSGGRQVICYTCGGSLKQLGKRLEQWL